MWDYTRNRWSANQAETYVREIQRVIELVADNPTHREALRRGGSAARSG
ncbi:type II toxin-antitoxin system RelE/ParE family toxin, partial [Mycobacterium avium]